MKLQRLELENFRQYHGKQRIDFADDSRRHVTVIHGINGSGKTSLFMALNWCLYGNSTVENVGALVSKEALMRVEIGRIVQTSVKLLFSHDGKRYSMTRTISARRTFTGEIVHDNDDILGMRRMTASGDSKRESSPITTINAILPENIRTYFLFDGEKIDNFARPEAAEEVRHAIYLILRLEILERARKHFKDAAKDYRSELRTLEGDSALGKLLAEATQAEEKKAAAEARLREIGTELQAARKRIAEIDQALEGMEGIRELQQARTHIEGALKKARIALEKLTEDIQAAASLGALVLVRPILDQALAILDEKRAKGQIPSNIRQQFVQDLLHDLTCICGRPLVEHQPEYVRLVELMQTTVPSKLEHIVLNTNNNLRGLYVKSSSHRDNLREKMQWRVIRRTEISDLEGRLSDLQHQLRDSPAEDVANLERQRQQFRTDVDSYLSDEGALKWEINSAETRLKELGRLISKAQKSSARVQHVTAKLALANDAARAIDETYQRHADNMREQIEQQTNQIFHTLIWKDSHFQKIQLDENYNLEVFDRYGLAARPELSAGERQVLSLSFITAMAQVSGEEAPLVMDTPFGRLSSHHRHTITENLPKLASQLILFVTDAEFSEPMRHNLAAYIGREYWLDFNRTTSCTQIEEHA